MLKKLSKKIKRKFLLCLLTSLFVLVTLSFGSAKINKAGPRSITLSKANYTELIIMASEGPIYKNNAEEYKILYKETEKKLSKSPKWEHVFIALLLGMVI